MYVENIFSLQMTIAELKNDYNCYLFIAMSELNIASIQHPRPIEVYGTQILFFFPSFF